MAIRAILILLGVVLVASAPDVALPQADAFAQADCEKDFMSIRAELEKRGIALQKAGERKAGPVEGCRLLRNYTAQEARMIKFFTERQQVCQIPGEVIKQAREGHTKALAMRDNACQAAAAPKGPPPPPPSAGLSGALGRGTAGGPPPDSQGGGTVFDTLGGNILRENP